MTLMFHCGPCSLTHVKNLNSSSVTPTTFGRCGPQNMSGENVRKYVAKLRGNLRSGGLK